MSAPNTRTAALCTGLGILALAAIAAAALPIVARRGARPRRLRIDLGLARVTVTRLDGGRP